MPDLYTTIRAAVIDAAGISVNATRRVSTVDGHILPFGAGFSS